MMSIDLSGLRSWQSVIDEAKRASKLPTWVHLAILFEYANLTFGVDAERFIRDVSLLNTPSTLNQWVRNLEIWKKTALATRMRIRHVSYYQEARRCKKYVNGQWTATQAVEHQKKRRRERTFAHYIRGLNPMATMIEDGTPPLPQSLTPEAAKELLESLITISRFLVEIAKSRAA